MNHTPEPPLLRVENLNVALHTRRGPVGIVDHLDFEVRRSEILALVGESGCGKSLSCLALTGLLGAGLEATADRIGFSFRGTELDLAHLTERALRKVRGAGVGYIFQEPAASLNPVFRVGAQIAESLELHRPEIHDPAAEVVRLLEQVGIPDAGNRARAYPHELSGGMQQRVMIAMALAGNPELLIADEPTTALDVTIQAQILDLVCELRNRTGMGVVLVTHNLGIVAETADRVAVMYAGEIVETAPAAALFAHPRHPYTAALMRAVPRLDSPGYELETIPGTVPVPGEFPSGCRFFGRCPRAGKLAPEERKRCASEHPRLESGCRCHFPL